MADVKHFTIDARLLKVIAVTYPHLIHESQQNITPVMNDLGNIQLRLPILPPLRRQPAQTFIHCNDTQTA